MIRFTFGILLFELAVDPLRAAFNSIYIFGDTVSTTTNNTGLYPSPTNYFGHRFSNGRVWVEVLAQRQGLPNNSVTNANWFYSTNNWSYWGDYSSELVKNVGIFNAPTNATNALFVVWVNDADFTYDVLNYGTNITQWTNAMNLSLTNHFVAITNLFAKGARTLIMPNAVDIGKVPDYLTYGSNKLAFIRQHIIDFNAAFTTTLVNRLKTNCPGITIYVPDFFSLLDNMLINAAVYGLTNAGTYALNQNPTNALTDLSMTGPGANYIWWDDEDPTAKAQAVMADVAQQLLSPAQITKLTVLNGSNRLDVASLPIGLNGLVDGTTNLALTNWAAQANFDSTNATQTIFVPASGPLGFYRLRFPFAWSWP
ncbi:MAG: SGNH/GDSL hydrolase family protein [Verrucomicrobiota bacterium]